jgi:hypothetical protein
MAALGIPDCSLAEEEIRETFVAEATEGATRRQVLAITPTYLADDSFPPATMTNPRSLMTKIATVSHASPFGPEPEDPLRDSAALLLLRRLGRLRESRGFASLPHERFAFSAC